MQSNMVCDNRRVVEDFVLFKINQYYRNEGFENSVDDSPHQNGAVGFSVHRLNFPKPQDPPNEVNKSVRDLCQRYEERYKSVFSDLLDQIRNNHIATDNVDVIFANIVKDLFQIPLQYKETTNGGSPSNGRKSRTSSPALSERKRSQLTIEDSQVKWTHVIGLLVFAGLLAVRYIELGKAEEVDNIVNWVTTFFDKTLYSWLKRNGGWTGFVKWYQSGIGSVSNDWWNEYDYSLQNVIKYGAIAALGVGAFFMTRK